MISIYYVIGALAVSAFSILLWIFAKKLLFTIVLVVVQWLSGPLAEALRINRIPYISFDAEVSKIFIILAARFFGLVYPFIVISITQVIHFFHVEVLDFNGILNYTVSGAFLTFLVLLFPQVSLLNLIPWLMLANLVFNKLYGKVLYGSRLISFSGGFTPSLVSDTFKVLLYFALANAVKLFL